MRSNLLLTLRLRETRRTEEELNVSERNHRGRRPSGH